PWTCSLDSNASEASEETEIAVNIGGGQVCPSLLYGDVLNRYPETHLAELVNRATDSTQEDLCALCDDYDDLKREFCYHDGCITEVQNRFQYFNRLKRWLIPILDDLGDDARITRGQRCQTFLWKLMEKPESSLAAHVIAVVSFALFLLSSVVMCVGTIPELQVQDAQGNLVEHPALESIQTACIIWFTLECILRLVSSSNKLRFVFSFMNIVDFLMGLAGVQHAVQALRIARIFKLARHSAGLQALAVALKSSLKELGLMLTYMTQSHPETMLTSILQSLWWGIIAMTTVGYGDIYSKTTLGRCNAAASFLCGIVAIALPVHLIINNFILVYNKQRVLETTAKHEIELMALRAKDEAQDKLTKVLSSVHLFVRSGENSVLQKKSLRLVEFYIRNISIIKITGYKNLYECKKKFKKVRVP
uniref:Potassium voltage-gated channel, subfamily F, member 1a n=1 Tax=Sinocyclocheilus rhinocerous TaxID=307959 RepID=A0A673GGE9_9TELE